MNWNIKYQLFLLAIIFSLGSQAQEVIGSEVLQGDDDEPAFYKTDYKRSIILEFGRPFTFANDGFRKNYTGLFHVKGNLNLVSKNGFLFGGYAGMHSFDNTRFDNVNHPSLKTEITKNNNITAGLQFGLERKKEREKPILISYINIGYGSASFSKKETLTNTELARYEEEGFNAGITLCYGIFIEDKSAVMAILSYQMISTKYDPTKLEVIDHEANGGATQFLSFGLVFNFGF